MKIFTVICPLNGPVTVLPHLVVKQVRTGLSHYIYLFPDDRLLMQIPVMEIPALIKENEESCWITNCLVSSPSKGERPLLVEDKLEKDPRYQHDVLVYLETWSPYPAYMLVNMKSQPLWRWKSHATAPPHGQEIWRLRPGDVLCPNIQGCRIEIANKGGDIEVVYPLGSVALEPAPAERPVIIPFRTPAQQPKPEEQPLELERPLTLWQRVKLKLTHFLQFLQRMFQSIG